MGGAVGRPEVRTGGTCICGRGIGVGLGAVSGSRSHGEGKKGSTREGLALMLAFPLGVGAQLGFERCSAEPQS